jgi:hypothetical protein
LHRAAWWSLSSGSFWPASSVCFPVWRWAAQPPELRLSADAPRVNLTLHMAAQRLPATTALNPDQAWDGAPDQPLLEPSPRWQSSPGMRLVGRVVLQGAGAEGTYVVHVPTAWFDVGAGLAA